MDADPSTQNSVEKRSSALVVFPDCHRSSADIRSFFAPSERLLPAVVVDCDKYFKSDNANSLDALLSELAALDTRTYSLVGLGRGSILSVEAAVRTKRKTRRLLLVNPLLRSRSLLDSPFSPFAKDALTRLHRVHCPTEIVISRNALFPKFSTADAQLFLERIPNARLRKPGDDANDGLPEIMAHFQRIPAKCPQRRRPSQKNSRKK